MGDMANDLIDQIEQGQSLVLVIKTGERIVVDNVILMYTNIYPEQEYKVLDDYHGDKYNNDITL